MDVSECHEVYVGPSLDLYIIGVVCMYVCNEKAYFLYSRDFDDLEEEKIVIIIIGFN